MKIALLTDGIFPFVLGGMQKHSTNLARYLTLAGCEVTLHHCVFGEEKEPTEEEVNKRLFGDEGQLKKIVCHRFPTSVRYPGHYVYNSWKYSQLVFEEIKSDLDHFDLIYAKGFSAWKLLSMKKNGLKAPPVGVKFHGYEMFQPATGTSMKLKQQLLRPPTKWNNQNADLVFSYGSKVTDLITDLGIPTTKILEIPSGIDVEWVRKEELNTANVRKFVFLGRYERRKGIEELNAALKALSPLDISAEFHFIGPIPQEKQLRGNRFLYHGTLTKKEDLLNILDDCDVLLCPSLSEGMPNVILEGMSRGLAVIATNVGAVSLVVDQQNGILLDKSTPLGIEKAIQEIMSWDNAKLLDKKRSSVQKVNPSFLWTSIAVETMQKIKAFLAQ